MWKHKPWQKGDSQSLKIPVSWPGPAENDLSGFSDQGSFVLAGLVVVTVINC